MPEADSSSRWQPNASAAAPPSAPSEHSEPAAPVSLRLQKVAINLRAGIVAWGRGEMSFKGSCKGDCPIEKLVNQRYLVRDRSRTVLGLDVMAISGMIRPGIGLWVLPVVRLEPRDPLASAPPDSSLGVELSVPAFIELLVPFSQQTALALRGMLGPQLIAGTKDSALRNDVLAQRSFCTTLREAGVASSCSPSTSYRWGMMFGATVGLVFRTSRHLGVRADAAVQTTDQRLFDLQASGPDWALSQHYDYTGVRIMAMLALEAGR